MKVTLLKLANEIYDKLEIYKAERNKYKKAFESIAKMHNDKKENIFVDLTEETVLFPIEEFLCFLESKIILLNEEIETLEQKFNQL